MLNRVLVVGNANCNASVDDGGCGAHSATGSQVALKAGQRAAVNTR